MVKLLKKGVSNSTWTIVSLNVTLPDEVSERIFLFRVSSLVKAYMVRGFGLELMNSMLS